MYFSETPSFSRTENGQHVDGLWDGFKFSSPETLNLNPTYTCIISCSYIRPALRCLPRPPPAAAHARARRGYVLQRSQPPPSALPPPPTVLSPLIFSPTPPPSSNSYNRHPDPYAVVPKPTHHYENHSPSPSSIFNQLKHYLHPFKHGDDNNNDRFPLAPLPPPHSQNR